MDQVDEGDSPARFTTRSVDGTPIAVWTQGEGPPLVLVHGSVFDHTVFAPLVAHLKDSRTTFAMNRRGFRPSGDAVSYSVEQDFEDVAAVVAEVADRTGQPVSVFGHSYGASCAMGGAARSDKVHRLVVYEPSLGMPPAPGLLKRMETALAIGRNDEVLRSFFEVFDVTEEEFTAFRQGAQWANCLSAAPTLVRETREEAAWVYRPGAMGSITAPTLMLIGTETLSGLLKSSLLALAELRTVEVHVLKGHGHGAIDADPAMLAEVIRCFLAAPGQNQKR